MEILIAIILVLILVTEYITYKVKTNQIFKLKVRKLFKLE